MAVNRKFPERSLVDAPKRQCRDGNPCDRAPSPAYRINVADGRLREHSASAVFQAFVIIELSRE